MNNKKNYDIRKNEILDVAEKLFSHKGFDYTSTNDILKEIGIARGTLYYYFASKEDILDAIIDRMTKQLICNAKTIASDKKIPVLKRLTLTIMSLNINTDIGHEVFEQIHRPQNALMHQKMQDNLLVEGNPIITSLIEEAIECGLCKTLYPKETVEMILLYSNIAFDSNLVESDEERRKKIEAFIYNLEKLFEMKRNSMKEVIESII